MAVFLPSSADIELRRSKNYKLMAAEQCFLAGNWSMTTYSVLVHVQMSEQDQARQNSIRDRGWAHEVLLITEVLLTGYGSEWKEVTWRPFHCLWAYIHASSDSFK